MNYTIEEYTGNIDNIPWQDGFLNELDGLSIDEQLRCFAWTTYFNLTKIPFNQLDSKCSESSSYSSSIEPLNDETVLVKDGKIVGVKIKMPYVDKSFKVNYKMITVMPYGKYCYSSTSDNNGAGYKEKDWYKYLICLPAHHTIW